MYAGEKKRTDLAIFYPHFSTLSIYVCYRCVSCLSTKWKCYWDQKNHLCVASKDDYNHNLLEVSNVFLIHQSDVIIPTLLPKNTVFCKESYNLGKRNDVITQCEVVSVTITVCKNVEISYNVSDGFAFGNFKPLKFLVLKRLSVRISGVAVLLFDWKRFNSLLDTKVELTPTSSTVGFYIPLFRSLTAQMKRYVCQCQPPWGVKYFETQTNHQIV